MTEHTNPVKGIRDKCIDCCCDQVSEVAKCTTVNCPLYKWRFGKNPYRTASEGEPMYYGYLGVLTKKVAAAAGLPEEKQFGPHALRHPYVKYATKKFVFPYALKSWIL